MELISYILMSFTVYGVAKILLIEINNHKRAIKNIKDKEPESEN